MQENLDKIYGYVMQYGLSFIAAFVIFIVGKWVAHFVANFAQRLMLKAHVEKTLALFGKNILYSIIMAFVVVAALNKLGVETTSFVAILGAAGLTVGLALQGSLANFAAGVMLVMFKPFKVGDFIEAGGVLGSVQEIQIFNTILSAPDNRRIVVPNSKITGDNITNFSDLDKRRIDLIFGISYGDVYAQGQRSPDESCFG